MQNEKKMSIGVLYGGPSGEREVSMRSSENVLKNLSREKYRVCKIEIVTEDTWKCEDEDGLAHDISVGDPEAVEFLKRFDVFFNVLHGTFGEDGKLQRILDAIGVPYTGSGVEASALAMDKAKSMGMASAEGIRVPEFFLAGEADGIDAISEKIQGSFGYPAIVKPNDSGSTLGLSLVKEEKELEKALQTSLAESKDILVQRYIAGREFTCGVLGNADDSQIMPLLPVEIIVPKNVLFDYNYKYNSNETQEICPAQIDAELAETIQRFSIQAHKLFGCDGVSRSDFRLDEKGELFFLETNTSPGMAEVSLCPKEALAAGMSLSEFLDRIIELAVAKGRPHS